MLRFQALASNFKFQAFNLSRWIKETLKLSRIDITTFKGHSTRTASSPKVTSIGLSVSDILNRGSWSQKSTW